VHATGLFDDVFVRTFVPQLFDEQLAKWSATSAWNERLNARYPNFRLHLISATEQALGMMAGCEVSLVEGSPDVGADERGVEAVVRIDSEDGTLALEFSLACSDAAASVVAARLLGTNGADVSEQDRRSAIGEIANIITGRLQKGFVDHGVPARCSLPSLGSVVRADSAPPAAVALDFESTDQAITFTVTTRVLEQASSRVM
jgi:CheY-specific phosphatase CheX